MTTTLSGGHETSQQKDSFLRCFISGTCMVAWAVAGIAIVTAILLRMF